MENTSEFYYEKLKKAENPGVILATFYCALYGVDVGKSEIIMFNRLLRTFGRFTIFFSILDVAGSKPTKMESPYAYIYEVCKRRFESAHIDTVAQSRRLLDKFIESLDEEIERNSRKKLKIPPLEGKD